MMEKDTDFNNLKKQLTPQELAFVKYYISTNNIPYSVAKAKYKSNSYEGLRSIGYRLLQKDTISEYILYIKDKAVEETIAKEQEVLKFYTDVLRGKVKEENVVMVSQKKGNLQITKPELVKTKAKIKDRLKAAEMLGKNYGLEQDRESNAIDIEDLTTLGDLIR